MKTVEVKTSMYEDIFPSYSRSVTYSYGIVESISIRMASARTDLRVSFVVWRSVGRVSRIGVWEKGRSDSVNQFRSISRQEWEWNRGGGSLSNIDNGKLTLGKDLSNFNLPLLANNIA